MRIILTNHARMRATERWISFEEILSTIENPDIVDEQKDQTFCFKNNKKYFVLLVYAKDEEWNRVVITVRKTTNFKKYFNNK